MWLRWRATSAHGAAERPDADPGGVRPESKEDPGRQTHHHGDDSGQRAPLPVDGAVDTVAATRGAKAERRPDQKAAEQQQVGQGVVGKQVRQRPDLHPQHHRVPEFGLDGVAGHIRGDQQDERRHREQGGEMARPGRRGPQHDRLKPRLTVAPDDQQEACDRGHGIHALPGHLAALRDETSAPAFGHDARGMHAQEENQTKDQKRHEEGLESE